MWKDAFIHLFKTSEGKYLYDVNTDNILKVTEETYEILKGKNVCENNQIRKLIQAGYLKNKRVQISKHPMTPFLESFYENNISAITLQITQNCNLRCDYCIYSGKYNTRRHTNKRMDYEMVKKCIDFLLSHSKYSKELTIGFYGGEPLLEFDLIKKSVKYVKEKAIGKKITFLITTNATLLTNTVVEFLVKNNFIITVSFDGPKGIHDKYRKFAGNGLGTYDLVMKKVKYIRENYYDFFKTNVNFNMVLNPQEGYKCIGDFIAGETVLNDSTIMASIVSDVGIIKEQKEDSSNFYNEYNYEYFKLLLSKLGRVDKNHVSKIVIGDFNRIVIMRAGKHRIKEKCLPNESHHSGPCIPGKRSVFINVDGNFFPCERVCENSELSVMGNIREGIDISKAERIMNVERVMSEECKTCWAYRYCNFCIRFAEPEQETLKINMSKRCKEMRQIVENTFKDYCVLRELGYDFELDRM